MKRRLIVNADDFGQSPGINRGIIQAHEKGIVTSTSLMVRWPAVAAAVEYAKSHPRFGVGLHIDLCEWTSRDREWVPIYEVVSITDRPAVEAEVRRQVDAFESLMGCAPTHLDSHQHFHLREAVLPVVEEIAGRLGIPVRRRSARVQYCSDFYGQLDYGEPFPEGITIERLYGIFDALPEGYTEIGCHPGFAGDLQTTYSQERETELAVLCTPGLREKIRSRGIELCSFAALKES